MRQTHAGNATGEEATDHGANVVSCDRGLHRRCVKVVPSHVDAPLVILAALAPIQKTELLVAYVALAGELLELRAVLDLNTQVNHQTETQSNPRADTLRVIALMNTPHSLPVYRYDSQDRRLRAGVLALEGRQAVEVALASRH
jgi:hypothetical protein